MAHEKVHVICENLCLEEGMTKEQIKEQTLFYFNNVANMKASNHLKNGMSVQTLGYYSANDGGSGNYLIRTKTENDVEDNGSIHFVGNNLVAELIVKDCVNIKQLGAYGNGVTDDSQIFVNAITKFKSLFIPEGSYLISNNIDLLDEDIEIYGTSNTYLTNNNNDIFIKTSNTGYVNIHDLIFNIDNTNHNAIKYDSEVDIQTNNNSIRINNCKFFGNRRETTATAIYLDGVYNPLITECFFNKINAIYQELSINALISNCVFRECNYAINFNGIGATAKSCGDKIIGCDFTECNVGVKTITTDWVDISSCIIDYCLYPIIFLGQAYGSISNVYMSAKDGNPVIYINKDVTNNIGYLNGNDTNETSKSIVVTNCYISNNLEINYSESNPNLSADNIYVTCSWFTLNDSTLENYSRYGINLVDSNNVVIKDSRFTKTQKYATGEGVHSIYGTTNGNNANYDSANFKFIGIITNDKISRYLADISQTKNSVLIYENYGYATIPTGEKSVTIATGLKTPIRNIQLTSSATVNAYYSNVAADGSSFVANLESARTYPTQVSWFVKG